MTVLMRGTLYNPTSCEIEHSPSSTRIRTTAPRDNGGDGSSFSPTDLCAASLATCAATTISLYAGRNNIPLKNITFEIEKEMNPSPRRLGTLKMTLKLHTDVSEDIFQKLIEVGRTCPVQRSLHPDVKIIEAYERA